MAVLRPFAAYRPTPQMVEMVAALPYDVMNSAEAREMVKGNPYSFLHVDKAEIDLDPSVDLYSDEVYAKAANNLRQMIAEGIYIQENAPCYYIYRLIMDGRAQTGIVGCASVDDYQNNHVKKHELTRADKEADRIRHVDICDANTGPIFLTCRAQEDITEFMDEWMELYEPVYDFLSEDGVGHAVWVVDRKDAIERLRLLFEQVPDLYIADGHHRAASAVKVGQKRRGMNPEYTGEEEFNFFLAVVFPHDQLSIMDYNRVVKDLNGNTKEEFLERIKSVCSVEIWNEGAFRPDRKHTIGMYLDKQWYKLKLLPDTYCEDDPVSQLDVSVLQKNILTPILNIGDPRTDKRIEFIGGIRGLVELERLVDGGMAVAFAMYPTSLDELMEIADTGNIMPPKSTWFEPKLRSGIFLHKLSE